MQQRVQACPNLNHQLLENPIDWKRCPQASEVREEASYFGDLMIKGSSSKL